MNNGTAAFRVLDILDSNRDVASNNLYDTSEWGTVTLIKPYLFHSEGMHDLAAIVRQLGSFVWGDDWYKPRRGYLSGIGSEDPVDFFPDLEFGGGEAGGEEGGEEVGVAAADLGEERAGDGAEETCEIKWIV